MGNAASDGQGNEHTNVPMVNVEKVKQLSNEAIVAGRYHLEKDHGLHQDYKVSQEILGQGLCGNVVVAESRRDGRRYAVKTLSKVGVKESKLLQVVAEVEVHLSIDHPNIAHVQDVYESETSICMVTECCEGGELYGSLQEKGIYSNREAAEVARQMMRVVRHLHARRIVHRDLKLENFLYQCKNPNKQMEKYLQATQDNSGNFVDAEAPQLKLIDFGFARVWDPSRLMMTACGSAEYVSPDVLSGEGYTDKADLWSIGVIVWMLLTGYPPFHGDKRTMMAKIKAGKADWSHQSRWKNVTQDAKDFVQKLLVKDPNMRLDAHAALQHPWLASAAPTLECSLCLDRTLVSMQSYVAGSKLRRAALQMAAQQLDAKETQKLRSAFLCMDRDAEGWLSVQDFQNAARDFEQTSNESLLLDGDFGSPEELFAAIDANGDQRIYYSEFLAATARLSSQDHKKALKAIFDKFDCDSSGSIGVKDISATLGETFEGAEALELLHEVEPQGEEIRFPRFVELVTLSNSFAAEADVISPSKARYGLLPSFPGI